MNQQQLIEARQAVDAEIAETLRTTQFPSGKVAGNFTSLLERAILKSTPNAINCSWETFKRLYSHSASLNLYEMGIAINVITNSSADRMGLGMEDYIGRMEGIYNMATEWNAIVQPIKDGIVRKHETRMRISGGLPVSQTPKIVA